MKGHVDKWRGIVILIAEVLPNQTHGSLKVRQADKLRRRKRSDSSDNSPAKGLSRCSYKKINRKKSSYSRPEVFTGTGM